MALSLRYVICAPIAAASISASALAADEVRVAGQSAPVFADSGPGFVLVQPGSAISPKARVMAAAEPAVLTDAKGCSVTVKPGDMLALTGTSLCAASLRAASQSAQGKQPSDPNDWIWLPIGGGVIAAFILLSDGSKKRVSP